MLSFVNSIDIKLLPHAKLEKKVTINSYPFFLKKNKKNQNDNFRVIFA